MIQPAGAKLAIPTADFWHVRDGKIQEFNCHIAVATMFAQLGVLPDFTSATASIGRMNRGQSPRWRDRGSRVVDRARAGLVARQEVPGLRDRRQKCQSQVFMAGLCDGGSGSSPAARPG